MNAFMIMCHKNAHQVIRLAEKCTTEETDVFIHADMNMPDFEYQDLVDYARENKRVCLTARRHHGVLDTRSLCDIALEMVKCAKEKEDNTGKKYRYYVLLSGQDYLLKPMAWIENELAQCYPKPLIDCTPYSNSNWVYYKFAYPVSVIRYHNWINGIPKGIVRKGLRVTEIVYRYALMLFRKDNVKKKLNNLGVSLYGGSAWWILPDKAIDYILNEVNQETEYTQILLNKTNTPDETFFQIMTMRSPVAKLVEINPIEMIAQNCKTWAYFSDVGKPFKGHPYVFTVEEFNKLQMSSYWIARKFDETVDSMVLDMIDDNLLVEGKR